MLADWQELHNDNDDQDCVIETGEFEVSNKVFYEYKAQVNLYRGIPSSCEVLEMKRYVINWDGNGEVLHELDLAPHEFPYYIILEIEKRHVEEY